MKTIYKYPLKIEDMQTITTHKGADFLHVEVQHGTPCLWALVDTKAPMQIRVILMRGTGHDAEGIAANQHISTFMLRDGNLVFHAFDGGCT